MENSSRKSTIIQLERLEFGKLCVTSDGPILSRTEGNREDRTEEHRQLGWSPGFPEELVQVCAPSVIGIRAHDFEDLPRGEHNTVQHGTVLRPVCLQGRVWPVIGRVGKRPEDGVGKESRLYTLARYLVARPDDQVEPCVMFDVMESEPLRGITEIEAQNLSPLPPERVSWPLKQGPERVSWPLKQRLQLLQQRFDLTESVTKLFVRDALVYVMSGIPIGVAGYIPEELFFTWVTALWQLAPSALRPYLSAGWGVGASLSGKLTVTYAERPADVCALFSQREGKWKWRSPGKKNNYGQQAHDVFRLLGNTQRVEGGDLRELEVANHPSNVHEGPKSQIYSAEAGAHYLWYLFGCEPYDEEPREIEPFDEKPEAEKLIEPGVRELITNQLPEKYSTATSPVDFEDRLIAIIYNAPGLNARDKYLLEQWGRYLGHQAYDSDDDLSGLSTDFTFEDNKLRAFDLAYEALSDGERRGRAEALLWGLLTPDDLELFARKFGEEQGAGSARAQLFLALKSGQALDVLEALYQCAENGEASPLPDEAREALRQRLEPNLRDIDQQCIRLHTSLLNLEEEKQPPDYIDWVKERGFDLAIGMMGSMADVGADLHKRIIGLTGSSSVRTLLSWTEKKEPTPEDAETILNLNPVARYRFFGQLMELWNQYAKDKAAQRARLLPWLRLARAEGQPIDDPLLALAFGEEPQIVKSEQINLAIEQRAVPPSLQRQVARLALKHYQRLGTHIRRNIQNWADILRYWPPDVVAALWPEKEFKWLRDAARKDGAECPEAWQVKLSMEELENLIRSKSLDNPDVTRWYWRWAATAWESIQKSETLAIKTPTVRLCKHILKRGQLPDKWEPTDLKRARKLAEADEESLTTLKQNAELDWSDTNEEILVLEREYKDCENTPFEEYYKESRKKIANEMLVLLRFFPPVDFIPTLWQLDALLDVATQIRSHLEEDGIDRNRIRRLGIIALDPMTIKFPGNQHTPWNDQYFSFPFWIVFKGVPLNKQPSGALAKALRRYFFCKVGNSDEKVKNARAEVCIEYLKAYGGSDLNKAIERVLTEFVIRWLHYHENRDERAIRLLMLEPNNGDSKFWQLVGMIRELNKDSIAKAIKNFRWEKRR